APARRVGERLAGQVLARKCAIGGLVEIAPQLDGLAGITAGPEFIELGVVQADRRAQAEAGYGARTPVEVQLQALDGRGSGVGDPQTERRGIEGAILKIAIL